MEDEPARPDHGCVKGLGLHEDHKAPLVAVNIIYNVGSKDDPPGRTGFAHLFEHMMFKGSQHSDGSYFWPIYPYFASSHCTTECDRTVYRTTVTPNALELVLWLEADRMGFLLPALTDEKLTNLRNVVKMERRETGDGARPLRRGHRGRCLGGSEEIPHAEWNGDPGRRRSSLGRGAPAWGSVRQKNHSDRLQR